MILGIDASNIRSGGGITHLKEILKFKPKQFDKIYLWSNKKTLSFIKNKKWIIKKTNFFLNKNFLFSFLWQYIFFDKHLKKNKCNILFVPGGVYLGKHKFITMCRNMLPYNSFERDRYKFGPNYFKLLLLKKFQLKSFKKSCSVIFLNNFVKKKIFKFQKFKNFSIIPHGINKNKFKKKKKFNFKTPHFVYVSNFEKYKNFDTVIFAFDKLSEENKKIKLTLAGNGDAKLINSYLKKLKSKNNIKIYNKINYNEIQNIYQKADIFIFASSCENFPNILLEALSSGLPICCANKEPMKSIGGKCLNYFNEKSFLSLKNKIKHMLKNELKVKKKIDQYDLILKNFSWRSTANKTFYNIGSLTK